MYTVGRLLRRMSDLFLDLLFPATERAKRLEECAEVPLPLSPQSREIGRRAITFLSAYETRVKDAVGALKFERNMRAAELLAEMLDDFLAEHLAERAAFGGAPAFIVPVPLGNKRAKERGMNQVEAVLTRAAAVRSGQLTLAPALKRTRDTAPQTTLKREARLANIAGAFAVSPAWAHRVKDVHLLLIDDVVTTGATLSAAAEALEAAGARVECLALAG